MQWSQLRKRVEALFADGVRGRVGLHSTGYHKAHDGEGRYWITVDGAEIANLPRWYDWTFGQYADRPDLSPEFHDYVSLFAKENLGGAMRRYLTMSINDILESDVVFVRAFGMLDRRVGKRRLSALAVGDSHPLIRVFHRLRCEVEGLPARNGGGPIGDFNLRRHPWPDSPTKEEKAAQSRRAGARLDSSKKSRRRRSLLTRIFRGELAEPNVDTDLAVAIHAGFAAAADRYALLVALRHVDSRSKLLRSAAFARGVIALSEDANDWLRPIEDWTPRSHNPARQFSSLARHLWASFEVPRFMDTAWLSGTAVEQAWFRHLGRGANIRTAKHLPLPLTKRMAHHFLEAPATYSIEAAFRWGQVFALGGDRRLADSLSQTRLVEESRDNDFWLSVIRFFIRNPMLDPVHVQPIVDYLWNQRYTPRVAFVEPGVVGQLGPEQPNLSMRGRTVQSLLRAVAQWHGRLGRETSGGRMQWEKSAYQDFEFVEGTKQSKNMRIWRIRELLSSHELVAEGRRMEHCVASYSGSCHKGTCSIWSLEVETSEGILPLVTIEVNHRRKEICQVRGKRNRHATDQENGILRRWAVAEKLAFWRLIR